jgi:hypothetical protein
MDPPPPSLFFVGFTQIMRWSQVSFPLHIYFIDVAMGSDWGALVSRV